ncbi:MAG: hypothetical protein ACRENB_06990, partial [Gemmatimonadales bacterium]
MKPPRPAAWRWAVPLVIALVTVVAFLPALQNGFVNWDDLENFLDNPRFRGLGADELGWMWTTTHLGHYVPLTWMTLGLDYLLWGLNPTGYHLTSLLLHAANAVLLYFVARRILGSSSTGPIALAAAFTALLFSLHPLRVESVAWATERRDVLSGFFSLLSVLCYLRRHDASDERSRRRWYALALVAALAALLSKAVAATLPAVLLLLDVYPLRRLGGSAGWWTPAARRVFAEKLPFLLIAAAASILARSALGQIPQLEAPGKIAVSAWSFGFYLWKTLVPLRLSPLYPMPERIEPLAPRFLLAYAVIAALALVLWKLR